MSNKPVAPAAGPLSQQQRLNAHLSASSPESPTRTPASPVGAAAREADTTPDSGMSSPCLGSPYQQPSPRASSPSLSRNQHHPHYHHHSHHRPNHEHHTLQRRRSYSPPRSRSASARRRRGSGVFFNAIPAKYGLTPDTFQQARKTQQEIQQIKDSNVQEYYRELNELLDAFNEVEEVLQEHRESEKQRVENARRKRQEQLDRLDQLRDGLVDVGDQAAMEGREAETGARGAESAAATAISSPLQRPMIVRHTSSAENNGYGAVSYQQKEPHPEQQQDTPTSVVIHAGENEALEAADETSPLLTTANGSRRSQRSTAEQIELAINISMVANILLVLSKIWTVVMSASLAVLASMIDSLMDLLSGCIVWYSVRMRKSNQDGHNYPVGKARMEPLGVIVFGSIMMTSFAQVLLQSVQRLLGGEEDHPVELDRITLILLAANILIKAALWLWCRTIKNSSSVQALAQDHYIDVIFNIFSTFFPVAGKFLNLWWLDAAGAIGLSIFIIYKWAETCLDNIRRLTGHVASAKDVQQLTYMAYRFSDLIEAIDTVRSYYVGDGLFVEVDIVMARDSPLPLAHDIGESLQEALECLDIVERAFVHIDIDVDHEIEHRKAVNRLLV